METSLKPLWTSLMPDDIKARCKPRVNEGVELLNNYKVSKRVQVYHLGVTYCTQRFEINGSTGSAGGGEADQGRKAPAVPCQKGEASSTSCYPQSRSPSRGQLITPCHS